MEINDRVHQLELKIIDLDFNIKMTKMIILGITVFVLVIKFLN